MLHFRILLLPILLGCSDQSIININDRELDTDYGIVVFVSAVVRHGDRSPYAYFPKYNNTKYWERGLGQLSNIGKQQEYNVRIYLRNRYDQLLGKYYHYDLISARSTDIDRTLMSAYCILAGMYPPAGSDIWNQDLNWQPIPVHTVPKDMEREIAIYKPCERINLGIESINKNTDVINLYNAQKSTIDYVLENVGMNFTDLYDTFSTLADIHDTLLVEDLYNYTLPEWSDNVFPTTMKQYVVQFYVLFTFSQIELRVRIGQLLKSVVADMESVIQKKTAKRFQLYSGHDLTVIAILRSLKAFDFSLVPYSSAILFELRRKQNEYYVSVLYRNSTKADPYLIKIVTFEKFKDITSEYIVDDWEDYCDVPYFEKVYNQYLDKIIQYWYIGIIILIAIATILVCIIRKTCCKTLKEEQAITTVIDKNGLAETMDNKQGNDQRKKIDNVELNLII